MNGKLIDIDWHIQKYGQPQPSAVLPLPEALDHCSGEQAFQESLSRHSEYLPALQNDHHGLWFDWVLYKYRLPSGSEVDFAYVETTSVRNTIVLIEIEDPAKKMWVGKPEKPSTSKEFNQAIEQVRRWRTDLKDAQQRLALIAELTKMFGTNPKPTNSWDIIYGLVYGRSAENNSEERKRAYADLQDELGIKLMTYDHLVARHQNIPGQPKNIVNVTRPGPVFSYFYLNTEPDAEFAYLGPGRLAVDPKVKELLVAKGYEISAWEDGEALVVNGKRPMSSIRSRAAPPR